MAKARNNPFFPFCVTMVGHHSTRGGGGKKKCILPSLNGNGCIVAFLWSNATLSLVICLHRWLIKHFYPWTKHCFITPIMTEIYGHWGEEGP